MFRYKCIISYDGSNFMGFQIQEDLRTVELEIINALYKVTNQNVKIYPSGRTDRYVHAIGQVIHFDLDKEIPSLGLKKAMNSYLPADIYFKSVELVNMDFHSRFSAKSKEYRYYISKEEYNPLKRNYIAYIPYRLDYEKMVSAINKLLGTHDFKGFASATIDKRKDTVKTIYEAKINDLGDSYEFIFIGNGFLKYQIRRMMGLIIDIGRGKYDCSLIDEIFTTKDPSISHRIADGSGLYLYKVNY